MVALVQSDDRAGCVPYARLVTAPQTVSVLFTDVVGSTRRLGSPDDTAVDAHDRVDGSAAVFGEAGLARPTSAAAVR
jgi:hypothetical protein